MCCGTSNVVVYSECEGQRSYEIHKVLDTYIYSLAF